jgi:hypothetical protein
MKSANSWLPVKREALLRGLENRILVYQFAQICLFIPACFILQRSSPFTITY